MASLLKPRQLVTQLCHFFEFLIYPYILISRDKAEIGGILITINDSSSIRQVIVVGFIIFAPKCCKLFNLKRCSKTSQLQFSGDEISTCIIALKSCFSCRTSGTFGVCNVFILFETTPHGKQD